MITESQHSIDEILFKLNRSIEEAERRRDAQLALIASLTGQEREQIEARQVLRLIEMTILQTQQNYALVKFLAEPE